MSRTVKIHGLASHLKPGELQDSVAVVIDVLRASTTIAVALANGAARVIPCGDIETARRFGAEDSTGNTLTGGERGGVRIEGFDLGNSPDSYSRDRVSGKTIAFTTTNGTAALLKTKGATRVLIGSLVNRHAVANALRIDPRPVHLICAGTDGRITSEDVLGAEAIAAALVQLGDVEVADDETQRAVKHWADANYSGRQVVQFLRRSSGGCNLIALGLDQDIVRAAEIDSVDVAPEYSWATGAIKISAH